MIWLLALSAAFAYAVYAHAAVLPADWAIVLLAVGAISLAYWLRTRSADLAPPIGRWLKWPILLLVCYAAFQLLPLPLPVLDIVSPARAELTRALEPIIPGIRSAPISVASSASLLHLLRFIGYATIFFLVRELAWRFWEYPWHVTIPLIAVATAEAALGMTQYLVNPNGGLAAGTYVNRNHFAGLMEMVSPLAVMSAVIVLRSSNSRYRSPAAPAVRACVLLACAGLMLAAAIYSLSRMGFIASLFGLLVTGAVAVGTSLGSRGRRIFGLAVIVIIGLSFVFLPPDRLIERFASLATVDEISSDTRLQVWRETLDLINAYPIVGCGLGAYESGFARYQRVAPLNTVDFAHNDYLQYLAELGIAGASILLVLLVSLVVIAVRAASPSRSPEGRYLAAGCIGSMAAIAFHSLVDFNLYMPANVMALVWICGTLAAQAHTSARYDS